MTTPTLAKLKVKLFTDGADKAQIVEMAKQPWIAGFTTNPSLLKKAGVSDYAAYARDLVAAVPDRHISFEVFSDDVAEMVAQARVITTWGKNVYVKLPVTNTRGEPLFDAVRTLSREGVNINMTAIFTRRAGRARRRGAGWRRACLRLRIRRPACRLRHRLSADHAGRRLRAHARHAMSRSSGPRRARSSTSWRRTRWAATSSRRRPTCSRSFRARHEDGRRAFARRREILPRRCRCCGLAACGSGLARCRMSIRLPRQWRKFMHLCFGSKRACERFKRLRCPKTLNTFVVG